MRDSEITLLKLIQLESGLSTSDAARLSDAWVSDVQQELVTSGISVIRGLGTFTLTDGQLRFQQDEDFPSLQDFPAVEGHSEVLAAQQVAVQPPADAPDTEHEDGAPQVEDSPISSEKEESGPSDNVDPSGDDWAAGMESALLHADKQVSGDTEEDSALDSQQDAGQADDVDAASPEAQEEALDEFETSSDEAGAADVADEVVTDEVHDQFDETMASGHSEPSEQMVPPESSESDEQSVTPELPDTHTESEPQDTSDDDITKSEAPAPAAASRRSRTPRRYERQESSGSKTAWWALGILAVVVLIAVVVRFGPGLTGGSEDSNGPAMAQLDPEADLASSDDSLNAPAATASDSTITDSGVDGDQSELPAANDADQSPASTFPATTTPDSDRPSDGIVRGMGGYTLVVASTQTESTARQSLPRYDNLGLPSGVLAYETNGQTRYRIAVGNFPTAAEADSLRKQRASELPDGTWVLRIR